MVYLVARKIPIVSDTLEENANYKGFFAKTEKFFSSIPYDKLDYSFSQFLEKFLRKTKLYLMKLDNQLNKHLEKFKSAKQATHLRKERKKVFFQQLSEFKESENNIEKSEERAEEAGVKPGGREESEGNNENDGQAGKNSDTIS